MRKIPIFTIIAVLLIGGGYFYYQHMDSKVDITFNFTPTKKAADYTVSGTIDGAGDEVVTLPLSKEMWKTVKKGNHYNVEATFYNKNKVSKEASQKLKGPFWENEANQGLLVNDIKVANIEAITAGF
ncbi:hypothetical protein [Listeria fleischmannii]|jgi:hypothetical protein|uniref:Uncharacterized protein n=3 Tax=Listeria fleischmannii TaxID=1069827 RepID=A0A2X3HM77_9LIST|nr:hypothetical protein [Listeria fleischmannii]EMG28580.1 hypothetical protein LFLEISCH_04905 [Listeria fleischmannii subsp. fleischmannii LU2006-1]EUJ55977.1 hypothetical protein MCOL2_09061 [Listeria fleischmannii FSL S10-1203]MBC1419077.1 hypothetical protein [Listeria fleischmannii]SQC71885.1 Uncharacterised protein [Listeria fleischmannii subsp. fleischmannii]